MNDNEPIIKEIPILSGSYVICNTILCQVKPRKFGLKKAIVVSTGKEIPLPVNHKMLWFHRLITFL